MKRNHFRLWPRLFEKAARYSNIPSAKVEPSNRFRKWWDEDATPTQKPLIYGIRQLEYQSTKQRTYYVIVSSGRPFTLSKENKKRSLLFTHIADFGESKFPYHRFVMYAHTVRWVDLSVYQHQHFWLVRITRRYIITAEYFLHAYTTNIL